MELFSHVTASKGLVYTRIVSLTSLFGPEASIIISSFNPGFLSVNALIPDSGLPTLYGLPPSIESVSYTHLTLPTICSV